MVYNIEKQIVKSCWFMAAYRAKVQPMGIKWTIIILGAMFGFSIAALATGYSDLVWGSRTIVAFIMFSFVYDIMYQRVNRTTDGRDRWR